MGEHELRVGFVGVGDQGEPIAARMLAGGYGVTVFARRPEQAAALCQAGAVLADSLADLAAEVDVLAICVGDDADVEQVVATAGATLPPGGIVLVHSTIHPDTCLRLAAAVAARGASVVDAPVSGGRSRAFVGDLTVMLGGDTAHVAAVLPLVRTYASHAVHLGPLGSGQTVKLVNNYLLAAQADVTAAAAAMLAHLAIDVAPAMTAIARSTGSSFHLERFAQRGCTDVFSSHQQGALRGAELLAKDVRLMRELLGQRGAQPTRLDDLAAAGVELAMRAAEPSV